MNKYTVFYEQVNRTNIQVKAKDKYEAQEKARKIYKRRMFIPSTYVQDGWISNEDGEDK